MKPNKKSVTPPSPEPLMEPTPEQIKAEQDAWDNALSTTESLDLLDKLSEQALSESHLSNLSGGELEKL